MDARTNGNGPALLCGLLPWFRSEFPGLDVREASEPVMLMLPLLAALFGLGFSWMQDWPLLARESLFPVSRTTFIRDLALSRACNTAAAGVGHYLGIILTLALFFIHMNHSLC